MNTVFRMMCVAGVLSATACDLSGEFLFPRPIEGLPTVANLGEVTPFTFDDVAVADRRQVIDDNAIYFELGPTGSAAFSGLSFTFEGTDGSVCIWVDPEAAAWNQSVAPAGGSPYSYPDNPFDDADLELDAGQTVYYTGTPGEAVGNFELLYEDQLGNVVPVSASLCNEESAVVPGVQRAAGQGMPDFCTVQNTVAGVSYTAVIDAFSFPLDDSRVSGALAVFDGPCNNLIIDAVADIDGSAETINQECVLRGEGIADVPVGSGGARAAEAGFPEHVWLGRDEFPGLRQETLTLDGQPANAENNVVYGDYDAYETAFCVEDMRRFCRQERNYVRDAGLTCSWELTPDEISEESGLTHCFCGDEADTPRPGAF